MAEAGHRIVVLGGGSGGVELAAALAGHASLRVTLVDRVGAHLWKPRLHEFAAGTVESTLSEISFYQIARMRGFLFEQGEVVRIDRAAKTVHLAPFRDAAGHVVAEARALGFETAVIALGGITADFGTPGVAENAIRLDARIDADAFRDRLVALMIEARATRRPADVVIIGSGATGIELAAHLRLAERAFFDPSAHESRAKFLQITILEGASEIMPGGDAALRPKVLKRLRVLDIDVVTGARITAVEPRAVHSEAGQAWPSDVTVWAAGLTGAPVLGHLADFELDKRGRILVDDRLRTSVDRGIYALGDAASLTPEGAEAPLPGTAQVASQEAAYLADALPRAILGEEVEPFRYRNKGTLLSLASAGTVGRLDIAHRDDFLVGGQFAKAAYSALQRRHQWAVLGPLRGSVAIFADIISPGKGPALKLHGG